MLAHSSSSPGDAVSVDAFIDEARSRVTRDLLADIVRLEDRIQAKINDALEAGHHDAPVQARLLLSAIRAASRRNPETPLAPEVAEAAVALDYLLRGADLIPDSVEGIGLADDARILSRVIERNPGLASPSGGATC